MRVVIVVVPVDTVDKSSKPEYMGMLRPPHTGFGLNPPEEHFLICGMILEKLPTTYPQPKHFFSRFYILLMRVGTPHIWGCLTRKK